MSVIEHRRGAPKHLMIAVLVVSDTRAAAMREGRDEDVSGKLIEQSAREVGHETTRSIVPDDSRKIKKAVQEFIADKKIDAVITTGGTGIARRDVTIETLSPLFEKELPGFGEILRRVGYEKVGTAALLTLATAGLIERKPVFCLPGAPNAVEVAMKLILPELGHIIKHARE
ncbi:MAG: MogA/MoaB family molybdenum cofactor biosynthesis protein [Hadesarchaea archaeon]|nr:MogA/MoaB family molybdenum cofactor biosynthesis protein [Hadesarchaea archaeon]MDH5686012.1 MogA/MoaB family molybdenum cofactor biosynthesis protein [Hadesarchaea archaeon]